MTIEIKEPELEKLIQQQLESGAFQNIEEILWQGLKASEAQMQQFASASKAKNLVELFAHSPFAGLDIDFERDRYTGREIDL